ncbi:uncharacterized protein SRS1_14987 [Sporisorium reilianum f. sp. reilianum]|uniref:GATA-type domain-containing protein n=1 Tax=Sporisorium reilianum f. sp. reilianum TaxID=72559 RepID=A0A2N8UHU7_9BASI|nr:uncharacterized protein SRS1_14987 [Sporisorium reilianum f. sp. reilianum]
MEHQSRHGKVTLPPLSSLTSSIGLERGREQPILNDLNPPHHAPAIPPHDTPVRDLRRRRSLVPTNAPMHDDTHWPTDGGDPGQVQNVAPPHSPLLRSRLSPPSSTLSSSSRRQPSALVESPRLFTRGIAEATRPRSSSSPHRNSMHNPSKRSSLAVADASEVDRLLESLYHVQDVNRRLGLNTSSPASPSIVRSPIALEMLRNKILDELDNMALFSRSRAESIAHDLGFRAYLAPSRARPYPDSCQEKAIWNHSLPSQAVSSGQAGHPQWPPYESPERTHSSISRLTLEERPHRSFEHRRQSLALERDHRDERGDMHARGDDAYSAPSLHADPSLRTMSRAISFEQPHSAPRRHPHAHHFDHGSAEPPRFEAEGRMAYDHPMHPSYGSAGALPPMYAAEGRHQQQMELLDRRRLAGKGMKRVRKRKNEHHQECLGCQAKETPEWRKGPMGPRTLCNACGLLYAKLTKRKQQEAEAAARESGKSAEEIVREREESPGAKQASLEALRAELNLANGMRNRPSSSSAATGSVGMPNAPLPPIGHGQPAPFFEGVHRNAAPGHSWPAARQPEDFPPFAHQPSAHRTMMPYPHRSNSLGHVESFDQLAGRPSASAAAPPAQLNPHSMPVRPYTGGASPASRSLPLRPGRQRSHTMQSPTASSVYTADYDRSASPSTSTSHGYGPSSHGMQRRPHPYM